LEETAVVMTAGDLDFSQISAMAEALYCPGLPFAGVRTLIEMLGRQDLVLDQSIGYMVCALVARLSEAFWAGLASERLRQTAGSRFLARHWVGPLLAAIREVGDA